MGSATLDRGVLEGHSGRGQGTTTKMSQGSLREARYSEIETDWCVQDILGVG